jgi:hypothetical protein
MVSNRIFANDLTIRGRAVLDDVRIAEFQEKAWLKDGLRKTRNAWLRLYICYTLACSVTSANTIIVNWLM